MKMNAKDERKGGSVKQLETMNKTAALWKCVDMLKERGYKVGGSYVYPDQDRVYVRSMEDGGTGTYGAADCFVDAVLREEGWVFAVNNRIVEVV